MRVQKYAGWEDDVVALIPHEIYVHLPDFKGIQFWGNRCVLLCSYLLKTLRAAGKHTGLLVKGVLGKKLSGHLRNVLQNSLKIIIMKPYSG